MKRPDRPERLGGFLETVWQRGLLPEPCLDSVLADASKITDPDHWPSGEWREPLHRLVQSLRHEARLNGVGKASAFAQLGGWVRQRAGAYALWERSPAIGQTRIAAPIIVLGQMRSGTTRLQRLLGCDPRFNHTYFHEIMHPVPARGPDLRIAKSWAQLAVLNRLNPDLAAVHPTSARQVEEVFGLFSFSFYGAQIEAQWRVPGFAACWKDRDRTWVYDEFLRLLQTISWSRNAPPFPWVLKAPQFMEDLDALLQILPEARLLCLHRDPAEIVGSSSSLVWNQMKIQTDHADRDWIGREWLDKTVRRARICNEVRQANPGVPQIDIRFEDMNRNWRGEMSRIYEFLGVEFRLDVQKRMQA